MNKVVAIVGMCGSGKSVATDILEKEFGYKKVYFGGVTMDKLKEANLEITPENEKNMRESLRKELGMGAFAKILLPKIKELASDFAVVLDGLYSWDEYKILKEVLGDKLVMIAIVTDKHIRYQRLLEREFRGLDNEQAKLRDIAEIENSAKGGPISYADYYILNNGTIEEYRCQLLDIINNL